MRALNKLIPLSTLASLMRESHIDFRTQCVMTQSRWPPTLYHLRHSQYFNKIDSFLKPVLNICILGNLIVGCGVWVILKRGMVFYIKSLDLVKVLIFGVGFIKVTVGIFRSLSNIWIFGRFQGGFLADTVFGCKPLTLFVKGYNLDVWLVP